MVVQTYFPPQTGEFGTSLTKHEFFLRHAPQVSAAKRLQRHNEARPPTSLSDTGTLVTEALGRQEEKGAAGAGSEALPGRTRGRQGWRAGRFAFGVLFLAIVSFIRVLHRQYDTPPAPTSRGTSRA